MPWHTEVELGIGASLLWMCMICSKFWKNRELVKSLGSYEHMTRNQGVDLEGLVQNYDLLKGLVSLEKSAEIHTHIMKNALVRLLTQYQALNQRKDLTGLGWVNLRDERLCLMLYHLRKWARDKHALRTACVQLNPEKFGKMKDLFQMLDLNMIEPNDVWGIRSSHSRLMPSALDKRENETANAQLVESNDKQVSDEEDNPRRQLKKRSSEVSCTSDGFPACLQSPSKEPLEKGHGQRNRYRVGAHVEGAIPHAMGLKPDEVLKKKIGV